jgi:2'-5' RNA ligase
MRLFLGFSPDAAAGRSLYELCDRLSLDDSLALRWVPPENWHLTLVFLGEVTARWLEPLAEAVQASLREAVPCEQPLDRLSWFPTPEKARLLVVEGTPVAALESLQRGCSAALRRAGFTLEKRSYRPHLTLARYRGTRRKFSGPALPPVRGVQLALDRLTLFQSLPGARGPVYQPLQHFELGV